MGPPDHVLHGSIIPLENGLHTPIRKVSHPALQTAPERLIPGMISKKNALYPSGYPDVNLPFAHGSPLVGFYWYPGDELLFREDRDA